MATEIFRAIGTVALQEDGDIQGRLSQLGSSATSTGGTLGKLTGILGTVGMAAAGAASVIGGVLIAGLGSAISKADEFNNALGNLKAETDNANVSSKELGNALKKVYASGYGDDLNDAAEAMKTVSQATNAGSKELEGYTKKLITLSGKMDTDYNETMKAAKILSSEFGISIDDSFELMAQGFSKGLNESGDMLDVISEYSTQFQKTGGSAEEFFNTMIAGHENAVFSLDKLMDMQKEFAIRTIDDSKSTMEAFDTLGLSYEAYSLTLASGGEKASTAQQEILQAILDIQDPVEQNQVGVALLGTQWEDTGIKGVEALVSTEGQIDMTKSKMEELNATRFDSLGEQFDVIKRQIETNILLPLGESLMPVVQGAIDQFGRLASESAPYFAEMKSYVSGVFEGFQTGDFGGAKEALTDLLPEEFGGTAEEYIGYLEQLNGYIDDISKTLEESFEPAWKSIVDTFKEIDWQPLIDSLNDLINTFKKDLLPVIKDIAADALPILALGFSIALGVINGVIAVLPFIIGIVVDIITIFYELSAAVLKVFKGDFEGAKESLKKVWDKIKDIFDKNIEAAKKFVKKFVDTVVDFFKNLGIDIKAKVTEFLATVVTKFGELKKSVTDKISEAKKAVTDKFNEIVKFFKDIDLKQIGKDVIQGLIDGISSMASSVTKTVSSIADSIPSGVKSLLGISSPSKVMKGVGKDIIRGLNIGLEDDSLKTTLTNVSNIIIDSFFTVSNKVTEYFDKIRNTISNNLNSVKSTAISDINDMAKTIGVALEEQNKQLFEEQKKKDIASASEMMKEALANKDTSAFDEAQKLATEAFNRKYISLTQDEIEGQIVTLLSDKAGLQKLLETYYPDWQDAGQSLGEKIINGLNSTKESMANAITSFIDSITATTSISIEDVLSEIDKVEDKYQKVVDSLSTYIDKINELQNKVSETTDKNLKASYNAEIANLEKLLASKASAYGLTYSQGRLYFPNNVQAFANGVKNYAGGLAMVGEKGAELTYLPQGSNVYDNKETTNILDNLAKLRTNNFASMPQQQTTKIFNVNMNINPDSIKSLTDFMDIFKDIENESIARYSF